MGRKWEEVEINFLKNNYSNQGIDYCLRELENRTKISIQNRCSILNLKLSEELSSKWARMEDDFLKNNYSEQGVDYCLSELKNRTRISIQNRCTVLKLKLSDKFRTKINKISRKKSTHYLVDHLQFINITKEEISYILGFIWADGFIDFEPIKKRKTN